MIRKLMYAQLSRMMERDFLTLGPVPVEEKCTQVGTHDPHDNILECTVYAAQLQRIFPDIPVQAEFFIEKNIHEFGTYYEVAILFNPDDEASTTYALRVETQLPGKWDDLAIEELSKQDYVLFAKVIQIKKSA